MTEGWLAAYRMPDGSIGYGAWHQSKESLLANKHYDDVRLWIIHARRKEKPPPGNGGG